MKISDAIWFPSVLIHSRSKICLCRYINWFLEFRIKIIRRSVCINDPNVVFRSLPCQKCTCSLKYELNTIVEFGFLLHTVLTFHFHFEQITKILNDLSKTFRFIKEIWLNVMRNVSFESFLMFSSQLEVNLQNCKLRRENLLVFCYNDNWSFLHERNSLRVIKCTSSKLQNIEYNM